MGEFESINNVRYFSEIGKRESFTRDYSYCIFHWSGGNYIFFAVKRSTGDAAYCSGTATCYKATKIAGDCAMIDVIDPLL